MLACYSNIFATCNWVLQYNDYIILQCSSSTSVIPVESDDTTQSVGFINPTQVGMELDTMSDIPDSAKGSILLHVCTD